ncbi:hypothetical protein GCM10009114_27660 [Aliiglaciecola litoralis]|uniref:Uncharacterized protein n=1 Tax=Aliiglaciecola litoralis TaxID=582857 RepID=A0ABP3X339_9ALTE
MGPHATNIGWFDANMIPTNVFSDDGQTVDAPRGVCSQAKARNRAPIAPPPAKNSGVSFVNWSYP